MSSSVVCGYTGAEWELNSAGQNACQMYAALAGQCNSAFTIASVTPTSPPYEPQNNACTCNLVAYNLQAACGWCQDSIQTTWWLDENQWAGNCTTSTYDTTGIPSSVQTGSINIPSWAFLANTGNPGDTWSPSQASAVAIAGTLTASGAVNTGLGNLGGLSTDGLNGFSYSYNPFTYTDNTNPYYWDAYYQASVASWAVAVGVMAGIYALFGITIGVVYWMRQKKRRAWYGPMAQYYRQAGVGGYQGNYASGGSYNPPFNPPSNYPPPGPGGAPLLYNNEPNMHGSPPTQHSSLYGSNPSPANAGGFTSTPYQPPTNPFNTPYPTPGEHAPYTPPPSGAGSHGYKGHAEVY